ncbi:Glutamine synthetase cytosolic isozyme 1 [Forsythia ovata]|uniref:Glutamine synthetase cytosolic isozyme 1 n=1 Tax=Forsythia ovata TaxID=205694 RepID=A0ABD1X271_9LAMI
MAEIKCRNPTVGNHQITQHQSRINSKGINRTNHNDYSNPKAITVAQSSLHNNRELKVHPTKRKRRGVDEDERKNRKVAHSHRLHNPKAKKGPLYNAFQWLRSSVEIQRLTLSGPVNDPAKLFKWNYDELSTGQASGEDSEVIL